ncbi:MAG: ATPase domain-containing protein [Bacillota bacterium]|nr:ATPase domain-containing protein [Bacillota bacterium]
MRQKAYFGVEGLDKIVSQGVSYGSQIMLEGDTGVGKTVLAGEFIKEGLRCGDVCIYVACDEPPAVMRRHLGTFKVGTQAYEEAERLIFVDAYEEEASSEKFHIADQHNLDKYFALEKEFLKRFAGRRIRLVVDSLSTLFTPFEPAEILEFHRSRLKYLRKCGALTLDIFVDGVLEDRVVAIASHLYNVILKMKFGGSETRPVRILQVGKVRSGRFSSTPYMFGISSTFGVLVATELEV